MAIVVKESHDGSCKVSSVSEMEKNVLMESGLVRAIIQEGSPYKSLEEMDGTTWHWTEDKNELPEDIRSKI